MLWLLRHPPELLGVAIALVIGVLAHGLAQAYAARALGDRMPSSTGRTSPDPRRHLDAFGVIVMLLAGVGWPKPVAFQEPRFRGARGRYVLAVLAGPVANLLVAALAVAGLRLLADPHAAVLTAFPTTAPVPGGFAAMLLIELAVVNSAMAVLTLVPLPPMDGARILWVLAPSSSGWRTARYHLEERNIGLGILIVLMLPLFGGRGLLMTLVGAVSGAYLAPLLNAFHVPYIL